MPNAFSSFPASFFIFFPTLQLILFPSPSLSLQVCPTYFCPRDSADVGNIQPIRFPFSLSGVNQSSQRCGYPGFTVACSGHDQHSITLGSSKNFTVESIDYISQSIWVSDSDGCLPNRVLGLDLSSTPFYGVNYQNYTFLNCTAEEDLKLSRFRGRAALAVPCMSGANFTVYVTSKSSMVEFLLGSDRCREIRSVWSPVWWPIYRGDDGGPDPDTAALQLGWNEPGCGECERRGGVCGFENDGKVGCSVSVDGVPKLVKYGLTFGLGIPIFLIMIGLTFYMSGRIRNSHQRNQQQGGGGSGLTEFSLSIFPHPQPSIPMVGLDGPTIESYPKTLLGESKRLPNPSDGLCAICLSEYQAKESLRTIPECNHYFHAQCIDEWLKMQGTCPLCRNSPAKK